MGTTEIANLSHDFFNQQDQFDDLLSIFDGLEGVVEFPVMDELARDEHYHQVPFHASSNHKDQNEQEKPTSLVSRKITRSSTESTDHDQIETSPKKKRVMRMTTGANHAPSSISNDREGSSDGQHRISHITVERNRRKQMNEHLSVLRSLMPCFYVKRGDQASIIGGVVDYINELQQVLQSLEARKQRKVYSEILSPISALVSSSSRGLQLSPRKPPLSSPRLVNFPISPRTPQSSNPYRPPGVMQKAAAMASSLEPSSTSSSSANSAGNIIDNVISNNHELVTNSKSAVAEVEVKFSGANVLLKTGSPRIPGQAFKIVSALEHLGLEILHVNISTNDHTMLHSFTIKIGIECQLSAEELAHQIQQTF